MPTFPPSRLDGNQVLQYAFDDTDQALRVNATIEAQIGQVEVILDHTEDSVSLGDGSSLFTGTTVGADHGLDVNIINSSLDVNISHTGDSVRLGDGSNLTSVSSSGELSVLDSAVRAYLNTINYNIPSVTAFDTMPVEQPRDQISVNFIDNLPAEVVTVTELNGGTVAVSGPQALINSGTAANGYTEIESRQKTRYLPGHEIRVDFTAAFTAGVAGAYQRIGLFDDNNGFWLGFSGTDFVLSRRFLASDNLVFQASFDDPLDGSASSNFTRNGVPEAIDYTMVNVYRIRFGWLGNSDINFEVKAPDGHYVTIYKIRFPNSSTTPSIATPNLPIKCEAEKTSGSTNVTVRTSSWRAAILESANTGRISESNSTSTLLTAGATFTGSAEDILDAGQISVSVYSDQDSAASGLVFQYSHNGTDWYTSNSFTYTGGSFRQFQYGVNARFFRVVYTNGGTNQTSFSLQTISLKSASRLTIHRVEDSISGDRSAELVKSVITAKDPNGIFVNLPAGGIDNNNYTDTPLASSAVWNGTFTDVENYVGSAIFIKADVDSDTNGLQIIHSDDGVNDQRIISFTYDASAVPQGIVYLIPASTKYVRLKFINNLTTAQSSFIVAMKHTTTALQIPVLPLGVPVSDASTAALTKSVLIAPNDGVEYSNLTQSALGGLRVSVIEHEAETPIKALTSWSTNQSNIGITATQIVSSPLSGRKTVLVKNLSSSTKVVYIGTSSAVTTSNGYELSAGEGVSLDLDDTVTGIWAISPSGTQRVSWLEIG